MNRRTPKPGPGVNAGPNTAFGGKGRERLYKLRNASWVALKPLSTYGSDALTLAISRRERGRCGLRDY